MITNYSLRAIFGPYFDHTYPLPRKGELVIGRSRMCEVSLSDPFLSRFHAKFNIQSGQPVLFDLDSKNGTFLNGKKGKKFQLGQGDMVVVGQSIFRLEKDELDEWETAPITKPDSSKAMSGHIEEIPLSDLLQLLSTSQRSGVLVIKNKEGEGHIYLRKGQIYYASVDDNFELSPKKALFRILSWSTGEFFLDPPDERSCLEELTESTTELLMEGMQEFDELHKIESQLPPKNSTLALAKPLLPSLRALRPGELDMMQLAMNLGIPQRVIDRAHETDLEATKNLVSLLSKKYLVVRAY